MKRLSLLALCILALALCACGPGNTIRLVPPPAIEAASLPAPNAPSISVVQFSDARPDPEVIGKRRDGSAFTTPGDVAQWISRALADELARKGMRVTYASDTAEARSSSPDFLVTGSIEQVWLTENSAVEITANMRVKCTLANRKGKLWTETTNSSQTQGGLMSGGSADALLVSTLRDLINPMAQKILASATQK